MIEDESEESSRVGTPAAMDEKAALKAEDAGSAAGGSVNGSDKGEEKQTSLPSTELPADVRMKLRKLEKLEARYQGMLSNQGENMESNRHLQNSSSHIE